MEKEIRLIRSFFLKKKILFSHASYKLTFSQCMKKGWLLGIVTQKLKNKLQALDIYFGLLGHFQEYNLIL